MGSPRQPAGSSQLSDETHFLSFTFFHLFLAFKMTQIINMHGYRDFCNIAKTVHQQHMTQVHNPGETVFVPRCLRVPLSGHLNSCSWTSFNCHLVRVSNMYLFLFVCFPAGLKPLPDTRLMPPNRKNLLKIYFLLGLYFLSSLIIEAPWENHTDLNKTIQLLKF